MNKYMVLIKDEPMDIETPLREYGMEIYYVDRYRNDIFGIMGDLTIGEVLKIPFVINASKA